MSHGIKFWIISFYEAAKPLLCDLDYSLKEMVHVVVLFLPIFIIVILGCNEIGSIFLVGRSSPKPPPPPSPHISLSLLSFLFPPFSVNHSPLRLS